LEAERAAEDLARKKRDLDQTVKATKDKAAEAQKAIDLIKGTEAKKEPTK
jgi:hypothetical protein